MLSTNYRDHKLALMCANEVDDVSNTLYVPFVLERRNYLHCKRDHFRKFACNMTHIGRNDLLLRVTEKVFITLVTEMISLK